ncbi:MAG TPA: alpha/beta hydrolase-fold protein [Flavobacteriales bacterium]|nr:alpha/beta hydrolase-fold protein [Flavobacteriales bacterium]
MEVKRTAIFIAMVGTLALTACTEQLPPVAEVDTVKPFVFGEVHSWHSTVLNEERTLNVYLPDGYSDSLTYPVVYLLDGSANEDYPHIAGLMQFMNMYDLHPKSIVVGIANVDRYRDLTFPSQVDSDLVSLPTSGGSAAFMDFIEREVQPFVQDHYRVQGPRTIIGQSLGGLFAMEVLVTKPQLFDNYIVVSPSLWWNGGSILASADSFLTANGGIPKKVYLSLGNEGEEMQVGMDRLVALFNAHASPPLQWWYVPFPEETHATILHRSVYKALELTAK